MRIKYAIHKSEQNSLHPQTCAAALSSLCPQTCTCAVISSLNNALVQLQQKLILMLPPGWQSVGPG